MEKTLNAYIDRATEIKNNKIKCINKGLCIIPQSDKNELTNMISILEKTINTIKSIYEFTVSQNNISTTNVLGNVSNVSNVSNLNNISNVKNISTLSSINTLVTLNIKPSGSEENSVIDLITIINKTNSTNLHKVDPPLGIPINTIKERKLYEQHVFTKFSGCVKLLKFNDVRDLQNIQENKIYWIPEINQYAMSICGIIFRGNIGNIYD